MARTKNAYAIECTKELTHKICELVSTSHYGLTRICKENPDLPCKELIYLWKIRHPEFAEKYAQAKRNQADIFAEEILDISDDNTNDTQVDEDGKKIISHDHINRSRLRIDSRKWLAGKLIPKVYGENSKIDQTVVVKTHEQWLAELDE